MKTEKKRQKKSEHGGNVTTRQRILEAAFKTFLTFGYDRASTLEIATQAKVSKRELYAYFKDKSDLFAAGIRGRTDTMRVPLASPDISSARALARTLEAYGVALLTGVTHDHVLAVHRLVIAESARCPELAAILDREGRQANKRMLVELMRNAQEKGFIGEGNPDSLASVFVSLLWGGELFTRLLLRLEKTPSPAEITRRAREATLAFLALHAGAGSRPASR